MILAIIVTVCSLIFGIFAQIKDIKSREVVSRVLDKKAFEQNFDLSLDDLVRNNIIRFDVVPTEWKVLSKVSYSLSLLCGIITLLAYVL